MAPGGVDSENVPVSNQQQGRSKPNLTVEAIRARIANKQDEVIQKPRGIPGKTISDTLTKNPTAAPGYTTTEETGIKAIDVKAAESAGRKSRSKQSSTNSPKTDAGARISQDEHNQVKSKYLELSGVTEELLTYCHLLDNSRSNALQETSNLRETIRELEKLLDSARQRESNHLTYVEQQRDTISTFEKRYHSLKTRAKAHIKECQDERDTHRKERDAMQQKFALNEQDLCISQSLVHQQSTELDRLREITKNMLPEKEVTAMRLKLRRLEDDYGRLAAEKTDLITQLDEVLGKREDRPATTPMLSKDVNKKLESGSGGFKNMREMEDRLNQIQHERDSLQEKLALAQKQAEEYRQYCEILLETVPNDVNNIVAT